MDYAELLAVVRELIADTGRTVTFEVLSADPVDSSKPWKGAGEPTAAATVAAPATFVPAVGGGLGEELVSDDLLSRAEQICLVAPNDALDLANCTSVLDNGVRWRAAWVHVLKPGDTAMLYVVGVAR